MTLFIAVYIWMQQQRVLTKELKPTWDVEIVFFQ